MAIRRATRHRWKMRHIEAVQPAPTEIVLRARGSLGVFGEYVAGKKPAPHHELWFPHLQTGYDSDCLRGYAGENVDLLAPRGSAKSSWAAIMVAHMIGLNPDMQMLYLSHSRTIALRQSRLIKRLIESPQYREVFPNVRPGKRWADENWEIDKRWAGVSSLDSDSTFAAAGITGSIVGMRTKAIVGDDLIKSSNAIANEDVRDKIVTNVFEVVMPTLIPGGRFIDLGTLFRRDDIHKTFKDEGWKIIHTSAIIKDEHGEERSYWDRYKLELLQSMRERRPTIFTYQFQNQYPPDDEDVIIKPEWIKYGAIGDNWKFDKIAIGCDLAASEKESGDWTVFVVAGVITIDGKRTYWMLDLIKTRAVGNVEKLELIRQLHLKWRSRTYDCMLVPETNAYQRSLLGDFKRVLVDQWEIYDLKVKPTPSKGDKHERLNGISGIFANDLVRFSEEVNWRDVVAQLTFQETEEDDGSDATEKSLAYLQRRKGSQVWAE
jgi:hypothetical protein